MTLNDISVVTKMETKEKKHSVILESHLFVMHGKVNRIEGALGISILFCGFGLF